MTPVCEFLLLLFSHLMLLLLAGGDGNGYQGECPPSFHCGYLGNISFPFTITERLDCGFLAIQNCDDPLKPKSIQLENKGKLFQVVRVKPRSPTTITTFLFRDGNLYNLLQSKSCEAFSYNYTLPPSPSFHFASFRFENATLFWCNRTLHVIPPTCMFNYTRCHDYVLYYKPLNLITTDDESLSSLTACTKVQLPIKDVPDAKDPFTFVTADIFAEVQLSDECANCHYRQRGQCQLDSKQNFCCANGILQQSPWKHKHTRMLCSLH